jgi:hypothetical protein
MAIIIADAPIGGLLYAAYVSQTFIVTETVTTGQPPAALEVAVKNNGVLLETLYYEAIEVVSAAGTDTCTFRIDVREVVQQVFIPRDLLPNYGAGAGAQADFPTAFIECDFTAWLPNVDNLLEKDTPGLTASLGYRVINAVRYEDEEPSMQEFFLASDRHFLTSKPLKTWTDRTTNEYLFMYNRDDIEIEWMVEFRQKSGVLTLLRSRGKVFPSDDENRILRLGVGGLNILNMAWDDTFIIGGDMGLENPDIDYYEVSGVIAGTTTKVTETRIYYVKVPDETCVTYRIHFLNRHGVWDYFPVKSQPADALALTDDPYERRLPDDFISGSAPITRGHVRNRGQVRGDKGFEVEVAGFSPKAAVWLQELAMSPLAFIEQEPADVPGGPTRFYPIVIRTKDFDITDRKFVFEVIYSKMKFSQRV